MSTKNRSQSTTTVNRRTLLRTSALGGGALALAGAGAFAGRPSVSARPAAQDEVTLNFWLPGGSQTFCGMHREIADDYTELNPNVRFNEIPCGAGADNYIQQLLTSIAAGNPPDGTLLWDTPVSLAARNALAPIDELMAASDYSQEENWPAGLLASCQYQGQTYGLPVTAGLYGIWYNQEWFEEKGIPSAPADFPKTWDDLRALSKEFTQWNGDRLETAGFIPSPLRHDPYILPIWSALNGSQLYDAENQTYTIDNEANIAMMEYMLDWLDEEYQGDIQKVQRSGAWQSSSGDDGQPPTFQSGRLAATETGSWSMGDFYAFIEPVFEGWNVAPFPVGPGGTEAVSGFWPNWVVIPDGSRNTEAMFGFFDYLGGVGVEKWFSTVPDIPTNTTVPTFLPEVVIETRGEAFAEEIMAFWNQQAAITTRMWDSPVQNFANDQLDRALERIATKTDTPAVALGEAQRVCQQELDNLLSSST